MVLKGMKKRVWFQLVLIGLMGVAGCDIINPEESLPAYLDIQGASVLVSEPQSLASSLGIRDLWLFRGNEQIGTYQIPRVIPYFPTEQTEFVITGGVFETGLSAARVSYPFWQPLTIQIPNTPLDTFVLTPQFRYYSDTVLQVPFSETFEGFGTNLIETATGAAAAALTINTSDAFEGSRSGQINFTSDFTFYEGSSADFFPLPQSGNNDIWVEVTYKNNIPFTVGLSFITGSNSGELGDGILFNSNLEWNTAYIHVNDFVRSVSETAVFRLFIRANGNGNAGTLLLDQVRIIHFR